MKKLTIITTILIVILGTSSCGNTDTKQMKSSLIENPLETENLTDPIEIQLEETITSEENLVRGELISMLNTTFDIYTTTGDKFSDSSLDNLYYYEMMAAKTEGYLESYEDGSGKPDNKITRNEAAVLIDNLIPTIPQTEIILFQDENTKDWPLSSINLMIDLGIINTINGYFKGEDYLTKSDADSAIQTIIDLGLHQKRIDEIIQFTSFDGYELTGRLSVPIASEKIDKLVIFVSGTGPNTYNMKRENGDFRFNYVDFFVDAAIDENMAYFSYNHRGVSTSEDAPFYQIDEDYYKTYTPTNTAQDLVSMIETLRKNPLLDEAKIYLLGWSEGAVIAPLAVSEYGLKVDGLLLAGYPNENMRETLEWQLGGAQTFFLYNLYFKHANEENITKEEYNLDPNAVIETVFGGATFEDTDLDKDNLITSNDFKLMQEPLLTGLLQAIEENDDEWISENFMKLTPQWFKDHFNIGKTEDILVNLTIPIHIFHGNNDLNCPVSGVIDVENRFHQLKKENLTIHIYDNHDHDLNFMQWLTTGEMSEGIRGIYEILTSLP